MDNNKVILYPLLSKGKVSKLDVENITEEKIDEVADHFTKQLVHQFHNLGLPESTNYYNDLNFLNEIVKAVMYRSMNKYHYFQDIIDDIHENLFELNEDIEEVNSD